MAKAKKVEDVLAEDPSDTSLIHFDDFSPAQIFSAGGTDPLIKIVQDAVSEFRADVNTEEGRKAIWHFSRKIASSKNGLDKMRKDFTEDARKQIERINEEGKRAVTIIQELQDQVSLPLDQWKEVEAKRIEALNHALDYLKNLVPSGIGVSSARIKECLDQAEDYYAQFDWDTYQEAANDAIAEIRIDLSNRYDQMVEQEKRDAELEALRQEKAARDKADEEERLRKEGEERARLAEAERLKKAEDDAAAAVKAEAERAARAEAAAEAAKAAQKEAEEKAERDRQESEKRLLEEQAAAKAREEKAAEDAAAAVKAEAERLKAEEEAERKRREEDRAHKAAVHNAALSALQKAGLTEAQGICALTAISKGLVPNVRINY